MKRHVVLYPFFIALNFVLTQGVRNLAQLPPGQLVRPLIVVTLLIAALIYALRRIFQSWHRAGLCAGICVGFFFYYMGLAELIQTLPLINETLSYSLLFAVWMAVVWWISSEKFWSWLKKPQTLSNTLNVISLVLLLFPLYFMGRALIRLHDAWRVVQDQAEVFSPLRLAPQGKSRPDIYYIILDGYARGDILQTLYGFDNGEFEQYLMDRGFYIAESSQSNYMQTLLSLASSLNFEYLEGLAPLEDLPNRWPVDDLLKHSRLRATLENVGYQTVAVSSGLIQTELKGADVYLTRYKIPLNEFESFLLARSALRPIFELLDVRGPWSGYTAHRARVRYAFDQLGDVAGTVSGPKFVFAHILAPHPPFVFDRAGQAIAPDRPYFLGDGDGYLGTRDEYLVGYVEELIYVNTLVVRTVEAILAQSDTPPVIILQADHGPGAFSDFSALDKTCLYERFAILNAYYLPAGEEALYEAITPVNSFRVFLNTYFGANLPLLEDRKYFSTWNRPYDFVNVTDQPFEVCTLP